MKKIYIHIMMLAALVVAGAVMTSCQKEEAVTGKFSMTVKATKGGGNAKALSFDPNNEHTLNATWAEGEVVTVYKGETEIGTLTAQSDGDETTLYGTIESPSEDPIVQDDVLTLKFLSPDYNNQTGTLEYIAANCDYATATVTVTSVGDGKVNTSNSGKVEFENQQAIVKFTLKNTSDAAISATLLKVSDGTHTYTITPASATSEFYVAMPGISAGTVNLTAKTGSDLYKYQKTGVTLTNGQYYEITVKMDLQGYVDLGLPSGTLWATCNVGAFDPEDYGDYYAWGATETWYSSLSPLVWKPGKEEGYVPENAPYYSNGTWTKYTTNTDNLQTEDDAAYVNWGSNWRIPTETQWLELFSECNCVAATENGVNGYKVTSKSNGNYIFLPSAGIFGSSLGQVGTNPFYFTASLGYLHEELYAMYAAPNANTTYHTGRHFGMSVRPVRNSN